MARDTPYTAVGLLLATAGIVLLILPPPDKDDRLHTPMAAAEAERSVTSAYLEPLPYHFAKGAANRVTDDAALDLPNALHNVTYIGMAATDTRMVAMFIKDNSVQVIRQGQFLDGLTLVDFDHRSATFTYRGVSQVDLPLQVPDPQ